MLIVAAGLSGAVAVAAGAFASHGLEPLRGARAVELWTTASLYQMVHALALLLAVLLARVLPDGGRLFGIAGALFLAGAVLFPGALYGLGWWGPSALGAVAPLGGLCFILGWLCLAAGAVMAPRGS